MEKVLKYIKYCGGQEVGCSQDLRSHYFILRNKTIRVSDHIGLNSACNMNIICNNHNYFIWNRTTGDIELLNYDEVKTFIKHNNVLASFNIDNDRFRLLIPKQTKLSKDKNTIMGIDKSYFSEAQLKQINTFVSQLKEKINFED